MKYRDIKKFKNMTPIFLQVLSAFILLLVIACDENDKIVYGVDDEASAVVGFRETTSNTSSLNLTEGNVIPFEIEVGASKAVFSAISFDLVLVSGDGSEVSFTDANGNSGPNFTVEKGTSTVKLGVEITDNAIYSGARSVAYKLQNLVGDRVFLADITYSGGGGRSVRHELKINISDDESIPPLVSFAETEGETVENFGIHNVLIHISEATTTDETFEVTFSGSAVVGDDYTVAGSTNGVLAITLNAGETEVMIPFELIDDELVETDKTVVMSIGNISVGLFPGTTTNHTLTIVENDIPTETKELFATEASMIKGGSSGDDQFGGNNLEMSNKLPNTKNTRSGIMKFDITGIDASKVISAKVVLTTYNEADDSRWKTTEDVVGGVVPQTLHYVSDDNWSQSTVTWNSTPDLDKDAGRFVNPAIVTFVPPFLVGTSGLTGIKHEYDITSQLQTAEADNTLSLGIEVVPFTNGKRIYYRGKKDTTDDPKLIIVVRTD